MVYFRKNLITKITVFLLVTAILFWMVPSNLIFGSGESTDIEVLQQALVNAQAKLADAQGAAEDAAEELEAAQTAADEANAALDAAKKAADEANDKLEDAQDAADVANAAVAAAEKALADARAALEGDGEGDDLSALEQAVVVANDAANEANDALVAAKTEADKANAALEEAKADADKANAALEEAKAKDKKAKDAVAAAEKAVADAQAALDAALAALDDEESGEGEDEGDEESDDESSGSEPEYNPSISSDKEDYHPGEEVTISGEGFVPGEEIQIIFYAITEENPEGKIEHRNTINNVGEDGTFEYKYNIVGAEKYRVEARSVVENENGETDTLESDSIEFEVEEDVIETIVLGNLLAWTEFTDTVLHEYFWDDGVKESDSYGDYVKIDDLGDDTLEKFVYDISDRTDCSPGSTIIWAVKIKAERGTKFITEDGDYNINGNSNDCRVSGLGTSVVSVEELLQNNRHPAISNISFYYRCVEYGSITVIKDVRDPYGSQTDDNYHFWVKLYVKTGHHSWSQVGSGWTEFWEGHPAVFNNLEKGKEYKIEEKDDSNYRYWYDDGPKTLNSDNEDITVYNKQKTASITIKKDVRKSDGSNTSDPHHFWVKLYVQNDTGGWDLVSGENPKEFWEGHEAVFSNLIKGRTYKAEEVDEQGYTLWSITPETVVLACEPDIVIVNRQEPTYSVTVNKSGLGWWYLGFGWWADEAIFTLTGPAGPNSQERTVTLNNFWGWTDSHTWYNLPAGSYTLTESYPVSNHYTYTSNITFPQEFDLGPDKNFDVVNTNTEEIEGDITLNKTGLGTLPAGVQAGFTLLDKDKNPVAGYSEKFLSGDGSVTWDDVPYGEYYISETTTPEGFVTMDDQYVDLDGSEADGVYEVDVANEKATGKIKVKKTFVSQSGVNPPAYFNFTIEDEGPDVDSFPIAPNDTWESGDLLLGKYTITEIDADYLVTIKVDGVEVVTDELTPKSIDVELTENGQVIEIEIENDPELPGSITLNKSGLDSDDTAGFTLYDSGGNAVGYEQTITGNGTVTWDELEWDTYKIVETTVPAGYSKMSDITGIEVGAEELNHSFSRTNSRTVVTRGSITLNKSGLDSDDTAGFTLYNSDGAAVGGEKRITGNGTVRWTNLPRDTYRIVETTVPSGYSKMSDITGIVVSSAQLNHSFSRTNKKTTTTTTIEVLGIQELPFTGMNPAIPISGIGSILAGGLMVMLSFVRRKFRRK